MQKGAAKRLPPEVRSAAILDAAKRLLDRDGLRQFSLEAVAREAGVAASLPRHYFGSSVELLTAAAIDVINKVERTIRAPKPGLSMEDRFSAYLVLIKQYPWAHEIWIRSAEIHPTIDEIVRKSRMRLSEAIFHRHWDELNELEQIQARGYVGFVEAAVSDWLERGCERTDLVLEAIAHWLTRFSAESSK